MSFVEVSAQSKLRWSINTDAGSASLKIMIGDSVVVDIVQAQGQPQQSGEIDNIYNEEITYYANSTGNAPFICAGTETDIVASYLAGCFDAYGQPVDGYTYSESWSWNSGVDYDWTIQLKTYIRID